MLTTADSLELDFSHAEPLPASLWWDLESATMDGLVIESCEAEGVAHPHATVGVDKESLTVAISRKLGAGADEGAIKIRKDAPKVYRFLVSPACPVLMALVLRRLRLYGVAMVGFRKASCT
jgi:hypothetical protein